MLSLDVARIIESRLVLVGTIIRAERGTHESFTYADSYLEDNEAAPLSLSLPLTDTAFDADRMRPYFEGLLPEGPTREALANQLGVPANDYLALLAAIGLDCIGDVVIRPTESADETSAWGSGSYMPLSKQDMMATLESLASLASSNGQSRLSLAGTQGKVGLAHMPNLPMYDGWLRPLGGAASTHILKTSTITRIAEFEAICLAAARTCSINAARLDVLLFGRPVTCVERFDRRVNIEEEELHVTRLHQEDLAQAFGVDSWAKYLELEKGTYHAVAHLLENRSIDPIADIEELSKIAIFDYLVGNCDNHLKNLSIVHQGDSIRLAPAYDIVCTTYFEGFSRDMGKRLGSTRSIDAVGPSDFALLAKELGMGIKRMRTICSALLEQFAPAIQHAGENHADVLETLPYDAEDLLTDAAPRLAVVSSFANGF